MRHTFQHLVIVTFLAGLSWLGNAQAQTVATDPVGAISLTFKGSSDTFVSLPFHRPVALETQVQSISGNVVTVSAAANLTASQFAPAVDGQPTNYLQFTTGNRQGMFYTITSNDGTTITLDPNGDVGLSGNVSSGDTFQVIPYWTLNTLFPNGQGVNGSPGTSPSSRNSVILFPDNVTPGINLSAASSYYYFNGTTNGGVGWRKVGGSVQTITNDFVLYPDNCYIVRNSIPGDTQSVLVGAVPMTTFATPLSTRGNNTSQDIFIGFAIPSTTTLAGSNLVGSGAFVGSPSTSPSLRNDQLLVFDNTTPTINRSAFATYYYYNGTNNGGPGWRQVSGNVSVIHDSDPIFQPGNGFIIRKKATPTPQPLIWTAVPTYLATP